MIPMCEVFDAYIEDEYIGLREPSCVIHPAASRVNGITIADVCGKDLDYK
jgi:hypothetical protein